MANYDRFWDLHVTNNGWYDFVSQIQEQQVYQHLTHEVDLPQTLNLIETPNPNDASIIHPRDIEPLPDKGVVASAVTLDDIEFEFSDRPFENLVQWVNNPQHVGKLRVNCHGDGCGRMGMKNSSGGLDWVAAGYIVKWLWANGLRSNNSAAADSLAGQKRTKGLVTIALALCMGARFEMTAARVNIYGTNSAAAPFSAVDQIVKALRAQGIKGVEVTGSNEITQAAEGQEQGVIYGRSGRPPSGTGWDDLNYVDNDLKVPVPHGWNIIWSLVGPAKIAIPQNYGINPAEDNKSKSPSGGWILSHGNQRVDVFAGWIVNAANRIIELPLGWYACSGPNNSSWIVGPPAIRLAHSPFKVREIS